MAKTKEYLGDGAYVEFDGFAFTLSAPRGSGEHWVYMEPSELRSFLRFIERQSPGLLKELMPELGRAGYGATGTATLAEVKADAE